MLSSGDNVELRTVLEKIAQQYFSKDLFRVVATHTGSYKADAALPTPGNWNYSGKSPNSNEHNAFSATQKHASTQCSPTSAWRRSITDGWRRAAG